MAGLGGLGVKAGMDMQIEFPFAPVALLPRVSTQNLQVGPLQPSEFNLWNWWGWNGRESEMREREGGFQGMGWDEGDRGERGDGFE